MKYKFAISVNWQNSRKRSESFTRRLRHDQAWADVLASPYILAANEWKKTNLTATGIIWVSPSPLSVLTSEPQFIEWSKTILRSLQLPGISGQNTESESKVIHPTTPCRMSALLSDSKIVFIMGVYENFFPPKARIKILAHIHYETILDWLGIFFVRIVCPKSILKFRSACYSCTVKPPKLECLCSETKICVTYPAWNLSQNGLTPVRLPQM